MAYEIAAPSPGVRRRRWLRWPAVAAAAAIAVAATALIVAVALGPASAASAGAACAPGGSRLTVQGTGRAVGTPNELDLSADITVSAAAAAAALAQDDAITTGVVAAIESHGVASRDLSTTDVTINPTYSWTNGNSVISGYQVSNSIAVTIRRLSSAGAVLDAAVGAGGDSLNIDSVQFARSDPRVLEDRARQDAVRQAVGHAAAMAHAAGERLAGVCTVTDQSALTPLSPLPLSSSTAFGAATPSVPLERGTQEADAQVTLVYALAPVGG